MPQQLWEYHREVLGGFFQSFDIERRVDDRMKFLGSQGWKLVSCHRSWLTYKFQLAFKRRLQSRDIDRDAA